MQRVNLPIGTSNFAEIRREGWYYVDKTGLIRDLLNTRKAKVTLITRPRRFGKTLGMNMLANFFDIQKDSKALFEGLEVSKDVRCVSSGGTNGRSSLSRSGVWTG